MADLLNIIRRFLSEKTTVQPNMMTNSTALYSEYEEWCKSNQIAPISQRALVNILQKDFGLEKEHRLGGSYLLTIRLNNGQSRPVDHVKKNRTEGQRRQRRQESQARYYHNNRDRISRQKQQNRTQAQEEANALGIGLRAHASLLKNGKLRVVKINDSIDPELSRDLMKLAEEQIKLRTLEMQAEVDSSKIQSDLDVWRDQLNHLLLNAAKIAPDPTDPLICTQHVKDLQRQINHRTEMLSKLTARVNAKRQEIRELRQDLINKGFHESQLDQIHVNLKRPSSIAHLNTVQTNGFPDQPNPASHEVFGSVTERKNLDTSQVIELATVIKPSPSVTTPKPPMIKTTPSVTPTIPSVPKNSSIPTALELAKTSVITESSIPPEPKYNDGDKIDDDLMNDFLKWLQAWEDYSHGVRQDPEFRKNTPKFNQLSRDLERVTTKYLEIATIYLDQLEMDANEEPSLDYVKIENHYHRRVLASIRANPKLEPEERVERIEYSKEEHENFLNYLKKFNTEPQT